MERTIAFMAEHRASVLRSFAEVPRLQPYPDRLLDEAAAASEQPDAAVIERETIELAFLAALQVLPPRQRATLIARDVLGWPASQTAVLLEMSVAAANSALQRARATMREHLPAPRFIGRAKRVAQGFSRLPSRGAGRGAMVVRPVLAVQARERANHRIRAELQQTGVDRARRE